jgi:hypothetical protein
MFILENDAVADDDLGNGAAFVDFWSKFYDYRIHVHGGHEEIDYVTELHTGQDLTEENCRRLLRWKDPKFLTHEILSGPNQGRANPRVQRALEILPQMNAFRRGELTEVQFRDQTAKVFPNGLVWQLFLLHIAQPHAYPIGDQHVFRAFRLHRHEQGKEDWEFYQRYRVYFGEIARACDIELRPANAVALKQIDNALMVFGRFLRAYYRG